MKKLRNLLTGFVLVAALMLGTGTANAGILMSDFKETTPQSCTEPDPKIDYGVIVTGLVGVIVTGFTGVIVTGAVDTQTDCGVIVTG